MNTLETLDFVCSKCSVFSALADVVGLSPVIKSPLCNEVFFYFHFVFLKKKEGKVSWQACGCMPRDLKSGAFVVVLRRPSLSLSLLRV